MCFYREECIREWRDDMRESRSRGNSEDIFMVASHRTTTYIPNNEPKKVEPFIKINEEPEERILSKSSPLIEEDTNVKKKKTVIIGKEKGTTYTVVVPSNQVILDENCILEEEMHEEGVSSVEIEHEKESDQSEEQNSS
jgi:hypothetical protein